jgi:hypothetical protein
MSDGQEHYVYLIARRDGVRLTAPVKVGITNNLGSRLSVIQTSCPFPISLVHSLRFPQRDMARHVESGFHQAQRPSRAYGEWFDMEPLNALSILCLMVRMVLHANGIASDDEDRAAEIFNAGQSAQAVLEALRAQASGDEQ